MFSEADSSFQDLQIKLQYESKRSQDLIVSKDMLKWTVYSLKKNLLQRRQFQILSLAPEYVDLVIEVGRGEEWEDGGRKNTEEILLLDKHEIGFYYSDIQRGHVVKMKRKRTSWLTDLTYFYRRADEILGSYRDVLLFLSLITIIALLYQCDLLGFVDDHPEL